MIEQKKKMRLDELKVDSFVIPSSRDIVLGGNITQPAHHCLTFGSCICGDLTIGPPDDKSNSDPCGVSGALQPCPTPDCPVTYGCPANTFGCPPVIPTMNQTPIPCYV